MKLKNFIYLNTDKLVSLAAQVYEGNVEEVLVLSGRDKESLQEQKGHLGSGGRDSIRQEESEERRERRSLRDYAYSQFEEKLVSEKVAIDATKDLAPRAGMIVRVSGVAQLSDFQALTAFVERFNEYGAAISIVSNQKMTKKDAVKAARDAGLWNTDHFLEAMSMLTKTQYGEDVEIQVRPPGGKLQYTGLLDPSFLREPRSRLIKKYTGNPQGKFVVLGVVLNVGDGNAEANGGLSAPPISGTLAAPLSISPSPAGADDSGEEVPGMKEAIRGLSGNISDIVRSFHEVGGQEVVLDVVAAYLETSAERPSRNA